ncbi:MAG TPA: hypothetical protein VLV78_16620 [Thermoanaerobaculia bacterium]|nr:hypothetical protein [Thermoanaerobaculia bacterium]
MKFASIAAALLLCATTVVAQEGAPSAWSFNERIEIRANYRDSNEERFALRFPFPPEFLPIGETKGFEQTADAGRHFELSVLQIKLDAKYGRWLAGHVQFHAQDKYRRNPTTSDRQTDADELWIRVGQKPEFLDRPEATSFFVQIGKAPKMERQPIRLLESYGLAATAFNRMEDTQILGGGSIGRNLYWRLQVANGNPLFFRDPNALAGDNGTPELDPVAHPHPDPRIKSGFPILYNAEVESLFFDREHVQFGQGLGYRWQRADQHLGFDAITFHYRRTMSADEKGLDGTFYGPDLDLLLGPLDKGLPLHGRTKEEYGARVYSEWYGLTAIAQFTKQAIAGLQRQGYEVEAGYALNMPKGPLQTVQPAVRVSGLTNRFRGNATLFPAPSIWWPWTKIDAGVRIGFVHNIDVTVERSKQNIGAPVKLDVSETLVTLRVRI